MRSSIFTGPVKVVKKATASNKPGSYTTVIMWRYRKYFSQWLRSFQMKAMCNSQANSSHPELSGVVQDISWD